MFRKVMIATLTIFLILAGSLAFAENCPDLGIGETWTFSWNAVRHDPAQSLTEGYYTTHWEGSIVVLNQLGQDNCTAYGYFNVTSITATSDPHDPFADTSIVPMPFKIPFTMIMTPDSKSVGININVDISHYIGTLNYDRATKTFNQMNYNIYGENLTGIGTSTKNP